jgi:ADP-heptose:LPS heptosyltransferase
MKPCAAIIRADHIGDLVLTTPLMRALAQHGWNVDVVAPRVPLSLLEGNPHLRTLSALESISPQWPKDWWRLASHLRQHKYDAVILPFAHPRQLLLATALSGAKRRIAMFAGLIGRVTGHTCLISDTFKEARPYAETILRTLQPLGIQTSNIRPELFLGSEELALGKKILDEHLRAGVRVAIHPGNLGNTCNLPSSTYRELARLILTRTDWSVVVTGSMSDRALVADWADLCDITSQRLWISCGSSAVRGLAAMLHHLDALVVVGTGPLHIAHALGTPTLTPFCPQLPICAKIWGHPPLELSALEPHSPPCNPEEPHGPHCDFRGTIRAEDLFAALKRLLVSRSLIDNSPTHH